MRGGSSGYSSSSDEYTRKQRRPYTTYGGGGDYLQQESGQHSWDSTGSMSRTASGRRIPSRSPRGFDVRPRSADRLFVQQPHASDLRRSRSYGSSEKAPAIRVEESRGAPSVPRTEMREKAPDSPPRQGSVRKLRRKNSLIPNNRAEVGGIAQDDASQYGDRKSILKPILIPQLNDPRLRVATTTGSRADVESISPTIRNIANQLPPSPRFPLTTEQTSDLTATSLQSISATTSEFVFPFQSEPPTSPSSSNYEDDYSNWRPTLPTDAIESQQPQFWPLHSETFTRPAPPFISDDRFNMIPTPTESRLSTITEEGTVRESVVATPPNVIADTSSRSGDSSPTPTGIRSPVHPTNNH